MNVISGLYNRRIRGFRIVNFAGVILLLILMFGLYFAKTRASGDSTAITRIERQIVAERRSIRLLQAKVANLEQPDNISRLSTTFLGLAPVKPTHEITPEKLGEVAGARHAPAAAVAAAPIQSVAAPAPVAVATTAPPTQQAAR